MTYRIIILFLLFTTLYHHSFGQRPTGDGIAVNKDSLAGKGRVKGEEMMDSMVITKPAFVTPKKAALFSAIVPGLGQLHNKHYWKIPVIYVGVGVAVYFVQDNLKNYNAYRKEYAGRLSQSPTFVNKFPEYGKITDIKALQDYYRRNLDLTVLLTAAGYMLQVMDAVVFAHLRGFDISEDISLNARPVLMPQGGMGVGLVMKF